MSEFENNEQNIVEEEVQVNENVVDETQVVDESVVAPEMSLTVAADPTNIGIVEQLPSMETSFSKKIEDVKTIVLQEAGSEDQKFVEDVKKNVKQAVLSNTENEKKKADYEGQKVDYASQQLDTFQKRNEQIQQEDKWENKRKCRQYHYDGVKPIMQFVDIDNPMNLLVLYFLTLILIGPFLLVKLLKGTVGALICGVSNSDRPKAMKGFMWTILAIGLVGLLAALVYLFLKWQNIIPAA